MNVNFRAVPAGSLLSIWFSRHSKLTVFILAAIATAVPSAASTITQFSVTFAPSQTFNEQPLTLTVTPGDGSFSPASIDSNDGGVEFSYIQSVTGPPDPILFVDLEFIAPNGEPLAPGVYLNASNFQFASSGAPILEFGLSGEEEDGASEEFTILQLAYGAGGAIRSFGATFEVFDAITGAVDISGEAYYNLDGSLAAPEPATIALMLGGIVAILCIGSRDHLKRRFAVASDCQGVLKVEAGRHTLRRHLA